MEGAARATGKRKEGSLCQAAGWGYPCLTALALWPASFITVNEISILTKLARTHTHNGKREERESKTD